VLKRDVKLQPTDFIYSTLFAIYTAAIENTHNKTNAANSTRPHDKCIKCYWLQSHTLTMHVQYCEAKQKANNQSGNSDAWVVPTEGPLLGTRTKPRLMFCRRRRRQRKKISRRRKLPPIIVVTDDGAEASSKFHRNKTTSRRGEDDTWSARWNDRSKTRVHRRRLKATNEESSLVISGAADGRTLKLVSWILTSLLQNKYGYIGNEPDLEVTLLRPLWIVLT